MVLHSGQHSLTVAMSTRFPIVRSVLIHVALLTLLLPLTIAADRNGPPCTIMCEHRGPKTICRTSRDSLLVDAARRGLGPERLHGADQEMVDPGHGLSHKDR